MRLSYLFMFVAALSLIYGAGFVLLPDTLLSLYGITTDQGGALFTRLYGASLMAWGVMCAQAASNEAVGRRPILLSLLVLNAISFIVLLIAQLGGVVNALGWVNVALFLGLGLLFAYFALVRNEAAQGI